MVEISAFLQLKRLKPTEVQEIHDQLTHFGANRGGRFLKEQGGFFLFSFHPGREKVLGLISEFLFLTTESLEKKRGELFGYSLLWEESDLDDVGVVFSKLKSLLFQTSLENSVWAGPKVLPQLRGIFPLEEGVELSRILGPRVSATMEPLTFEEFLESTGWSDALRGPLEKQMTESGGRILRIKGNHLVEKLLLVIRVLKQSFGQGEGFPVVFPLQDSHDALSQLLAQVDPAFLPDVESALPDAEKELWRNRPHWSFLLSSRGGAEYPGDRCEVDASQALAHYFLAQIHRLESLGLPPVFLFLSPQTFPLSAARILEGLLAPLLEQRGLRILILENTHRQKEFLSGLTSVAWSFPPLTLAKFEQERSRRGWIDRFSLPSEEVLKACQDRGAAVAHWFWGRQEGRWKTDAVGDPSWDLLESLDITHQKVYYAFLISQSLLGEKELVHFFEYVGEDPAVIRDKLENLKALGFLLFGPRNLALRPDFRSRLEQRLAEEGRFLSSRLGKFLFDAWKDNGRRLSEIVYEVLRQGNWDDLSLEVLSAYVSQKINRGEGDFLPLLRPSQWKTLDSEGARETFILAAAAFKLRFALNQPEKDWENSTLDSFRKYFTSRTETFRVLEWTLQTGRFYLLQGRQTEGFSLLKKALLWAQEERQLNIEVRAGIDIGQALVMRKRNEEGREYFEMAGRLAESSSDLFHTVQAGLLEAVARFLAGQLSGASKTLVRIEPLAKRGGMQQNQAGIRFLKARLAFEFGRYDQACEILEEMEAHSQEYGLEASRRLAAVWKGRCCIYDQRFSEAERAFASVPVTVERELYRSELAFFSSEPAKALEILNKAWDFPRVQPYTGERLSFATGYSFLEDKALPGPGSPGVLELNFLALKAYLGCLEGQKQEALESFHELLTQKNLVELSSAGPWIYLWYQQGLDAGPETEAQRLTILGRGLKAFQTRASCIEDPQERHEFQSRPYWNARFIAEARKFKLL